MQHFGVLGERRDQLGQSVQRQAGELVLARDVAERPVESVQIGRDLLPGDVHVGEPDRNLGGDTRSDEALPEHALLLDLGQRGVHVAHVHAGPHVLLGELLQPPPVARAHRRMVAARCGRQDQLAERAVEDGRVEAVERVADVGEQAHVDAELGDRLERAHPRRADEPGAEFEQSRQLLRVQPASDVMSASGLFAAVELGAVPGRVGGTVAELAEAGGLEHGRRDGRAIAGDLLDGLARQACGRGGRMRQQREPRELAHALEHRHPEHGVGS